MWVVSDTSVRCIRHYFKRGNNGGIGGGAALRGDWPLFSAKLLRAQPAYQTAAFRDPFPLWKLLRNYFYKTILKVMHLGIVQIVFYFWWKKKLKRNIIAMKSLPGGLSENQLYEDDDILYIMMMMAMVIMAI